MKNMFEQLAENLEVELNVPFKIYDVRTGVSKQMNYAIRSRGIFELRFNRETQETDYFLDVIALQNIMNGSYAIVKEPWIPKEDETVYYIDRDRIKEFSWDGQFYQNWISLAAGNIFRSREEAENNTPNVISMIEKIKKGAKFNELSKI